jgi:hypothetical protein
MNSLDETIIHERTVPCDHVIVSPNEGDYLLKNKLCENSNSALRWHDIELLLSCGSANLQRPLRQYVMWLVAQNV